MARLETGEIAECDRCDLKRPIKTAVLDLFGYSIAFGPGGEADMWSERDGEVYCSTCSDAVYDDLPEANDAEIF